MNAFAPYCSCLDLFVEGRVSAQDAQRQSRTAVEILQRLTEQPGVVLADEVGMGKTFVALAVAVSVALNNRDQRPVVIMIPPSLRDKWPGDSNVFLSKCLTDPETRSRIKVGTAERAVDFLKLLDDPTDRRKQIIFITHGAMSRGLQDRWVKLALIYRALHRRKGSDEIRKAISRFVVDLVDIHGSHKYIPAETWDEFLRTPPNEWLKLMHKRGIDPESDNDRETDDDPVPQAVCEMLPDLDMDSLYQVFCDSLPRRFSENILTRLKDARAMILNESKKIWKECIQRLRLRLPLLVLDEAHHLKNSKTRLASLFCLNEAKDDAEEITRGALGGVFERMLFLTATPFQLGHAELCSVLERFSGVAWDTENAPSMKREGFSLLVEELRKALDSGQQAAVTFDTAWGLLRENDLVIDDARYSNAAEWWQASRTTASAAGNARQALQAYERVQEKMRAAEKLLRRWVIRHIKPLQFEWKQSWVLRRRRFAGCAIASEDDTGAETGIAVGGDSLLPFLLAARATTQSPESRPVFAEGLASSYEAFMDTRKAPREQGSEVCAAAIDTDDEDTGAILMTETMNWYLEQLERLIPRGDIKASASHPKIAATVQRVSEIWRTGEKILVFCHYVATGRILRQQISNAINQEIISLGASKMQCPPEEVAERLDRLGNRFFDRNSPLHRGCEAAVGRILKDFPALCAYSEDLHDIIRRNLRTPSWLVRFFPLQDSRLDENDFEQAMQQTDKSGLSLEEILRAFLEFLGRRCGEQERMDNINAVKKIQTGKHFGKDIAQSFAEDELQDDTYESLIPNVRLVNGATGQQTRRFLMLAFNTPFFPEVLVTSNVLAEGVDLHLNCRHIIHHDLCWNPSTLEQRTGRIDRVGAKIERCGQSIIMYLPFIAATQDEKMYRVVMDRERWFRVVMGNEYKTDAKSTDKLAERIPLPEQVARDLAFHLEVPQ